MLILGKLTFSILGFRFFGLSGFLWGLGLGHLFFDRTIIAAYLSQKLSSFDDNLRLVIPYKYYSIYDRYLSPLFGKTWGLVLGAATYGWAGAIILALIGHISFDMNENARIKESKMWLTDLFSNNIFKLIGFTVGFSLKSKILLFTGIIIGYFIDLMRSEAGLVSRLKLTNFTGFWPRVNILKLSLNSPEARKVALVKSMAGLAAKLSKADGTVSQSEINAFKNLFKITSNEQNIMRIFNEAGRTSKNYGSFAKQIKFIARDDIGLKEDVIENLFKIVVADGQIVLEELDILKNIAKIIELPDGNFEVIRKRFENISHCSEYKDYYRVLGVSCNASDGEIRQAWRKLTASNHPDMIMASGGSSEDVEKSNERMAEINEAYQQIMKQRK